MKSMFPFCFNSVCFCFSPDLHLELKVSKCLFRPSSHSVILALMPFFEVSTIKSVTERKAGQIDELTYYMDGGTYRRDDKWKDEQITMQSR